MHRGVTFQYFIYIDFIQGHIIELLQVHFMHGKCLNCIFLENKTLNMKVNIIFQFLSRFKFLKRYTYLPGDNNNDIPFYVLLLLPINSFIRFRNFIIYINVLKNVIACFVIFSKVLK